MILVNIILGIFLGGLSGFIIGGYFSASHTNISEDLLLHATFYGIIAGLLICIIVELNKIVKLKAILASEIVNKTSK